MKLELESRKFNARAREVTLYKLPLRMDNFCLSGNWTWAAIYWNLAQNLVWRRRAQFEEYNKEPENFEQVC